MSVPSTTRPTGIVPPPSRPSPPRWRDRRLLVGVLLLVGCVVAGSRVVAAADQRVPVWSVRHDLAAGSVVAADDLAVRLVAADAGLELYLAAAGEGPAGRRLLRPVAAGELLPVGALAAGPIAARRLVTVPVEPLHAPVGLSRGERVELWVTPRDADGAGADTPLPELVLPSAVVADVADDPDALGSATERAVVLDVAAADAARVVAASRRGAVDLVRVPLDAS